MASIEIFNSSRLAPAVGPFCTAVKANGFLFISGQVGIGSSGQLADSFEGEVRQIMENLLVILKENGLGYGNITAVTIYLKDMKKFGLLNQLYSPYFNASFPSRTCIAVADLPVNANVEMTVTAALIN